MRVQRDATSKGFTLVELLVVIGIISLLVSILLPALAAAKQRARRASCASQQHQVFLAIRMFANDRDGRVPYNELGFGYSTWQTVMNMYDYFDLIDHYGATSKMFVEPQAAALHENRITFDWAGVNEAQARALVDAMPGTNAKYPENNWHRVEFDYQYYGSSKHITAIQSGQMPDTFEVLKFTAPWNKTRIPTNVGNPNAEQIAQYNRDNERPPLLACYAMDFSNIGQRFAHGTQFPATPGGGNDVYVNVLYLDGSVGGKPMDKYPLNPSNSGWYR